MDESVRSEPHVVVITGMSGAGRSHAANVLEDLGYFVVDNLPADLIVDVVQRTGVGDESRDRFAVVVDTRGGVTADQLSEAVKLLRQTGSANDRSLPRCRRSSRSSDGSRRHVDRIRSRLRHLASRSPWSGRTCSRFGVSPISLQTRPISMCTNWATGCETRSLGDFPSGRCRST